MTAKGSIAAADEPSTLLRELRETADSDQENGGDADAVRLRMLADILSERRYAEAYKYYRSLDTFVRDAVSDPLIKVMYGGKTFDTHALTVDEAWQRIRSEEIRVRLKEIETEAASLRAELATLETR